MNPWETFTGEDHPSPIKRQLQGPRPAPLKVHKVSHKIKKPPVAPPAKPPLPPPYPATAAGENRLEPVIIYDVSPKIIHTTENEFKSLVQSLTGSTASGSGGDISPAARLASIEKTSPPVWERDRAKGGDIIHIVEDLELGRHQLPGILSPAPATLPTIPTAMFSPGFDLSLLNDLSPFMNNIFTPSPSSLLSAPMVSPSPSSFDILSQYFDF